MALTAIEQKCLDIIDEYNKTVFNNWFTPASPMASIATESTFRPNVQRLNGEYSVGLMQIKLSTAQQFGYFGPVGIAGIGEEPNGSGLYDPTINILYGMHFLFWGWNELQQFFGRDPTLTEWCWGYNEGYHGVEEGKIDYPYSRIWLTERAYWLTQLGSSSP